MNREVRAAGRLRAEVVRGPARRRGDFRMEEDGHLNIYLKKRIFILDTLLFTIFIYTPFAHCRRYNKWIIVKMKVTPLCLLIVLQQSYCSLAFVSKSHAGYSRRLPPPSSQMIDATSTSSTMRRRLTQVFLAGSPLESTSTLLSLGDVASSLQIFYTAALVAGVGYSQRMAGRQDFKKEMATKIANGLITPEELVDEITLMAEEINNDISKSKSLAEAAQEEVQNLLEEMKAMQEQLQQIPDALNIEKSALAIEKEEPTVKAAVQEKVLVTAGGNKERVTAGGRNEESTIPIGVVEGFGVYDEVFEMEEVDEDEKEWSVPVANHDDGTSKSATADESKESTQKKDTAGASSVADALQTNDMANKRVSTSSTDDSTESIRKQAEDFRARIKQMEARISPDTVTLTPPASPDTATATPPARSDTVSQAEETAKSNIKPSPPASEPPAKVLKSVENTTKPTKIVPDEPIRSSPLARLLCSDLGVELKDCYPGTGLNGRVIAEDVRNYAKNRGS